MKVLDCSVVEPLLDAFHDGELSVDDRVAVGLHLQECPLCAREAEELAAIGSALRDEAGYRGPAAAELASLRDAVVSQAQAERDASWPVRVSHMFDDMHLVWAGLSATAATLTCAALLFGIWFLSPPERADSLAGLLSALSQPGSDRNPVSIDQRMRLPRVSNGGVLPAMLSTSATEEDLVFALAAVVTQEGRIARSEVLVSNHRDRDVLLLMNAINEARFQPASLRGSPVAVNLVWLLTHTTVRAKIHS